MSAVLAEHILRGCVGIDHAIQEKAAKLLTRTALVVVGLLGLLASAGGELVTGYIAFDFLLNTLPGQADVGVAVMACSSFLAATAFHLYALKHPNSPLVVAVEKIAGTLSLAFAASMGLMTGFLITEVSGLGDAADSGGLFADAAADTSEAPPLLERVFSHAPNVFAISVATLPVLNFWLSQKLATWLYEDINDIRACRRKARLSGTLMATIRQSMKEVADLLSECEATRAEQGPAAERAFAGRLLTDMHEGLKAELRKLQDYKSRVKPPLNPYVQPDDQTDYREIEKRINALLAIDIKAVLAAFNQDQDRRNR